MSDPNTTPNGEPAEAEPSVDDAVARDFQQWPHFVSTAPGVAYAYLEDYRRTRPDLYHQAATLESLAAKVGVADNDTMGARLVGPGSTGG